MMIVMMRIKIMTIMMLAMMMVIFLLIMAMIMVKMMIMSMIGLCFFFYFYVAFSFSIFFFFYISYSSFPPYLFLSYSFSTRLARYSVHEDNSYFSFSLGCLPDQGNYFTYKPEDVHNPAQVTRKSTLQEVKSRLYTQHRIKFRESKLRTAQLRQSTLETVQ